MKRGTPTQNFIQFDKIKDGILILKNKGLRAILAVSSINFALKSEAEQAGIIYQFQNFLNSLDFPCQILVQSRKLNITGYLEKLKEIEQAQKNELLKLQTKEYQNFISELIQDRVIMQKNFYVVIPFALSEIKNLGPSFQFTDLSEEDFQRAKTQLFQRAEFVALGLRAIGLKTALLNSYEVAELFWALHHPNEAERGFYPEIPPELVE